MVWGVSTVQPGASYSPELALDLQGGTQIILTPTVAEGEQASAEQLNQAVTIIRQRIDGSGVGEAQVSIQGNQNIVVAIPGTPDATTLQLIRASALLEFRPVIEQGISQPAAEGTAPVDLDALSNELTAEPANASDPAWITERIRAEFDNFDCSVPFRDAGQVDDPTVALVTCDEYYLYKYILGPVEVQGASISDASAGTVTTQTGASTNTWAVNLEFNSEGTSAFGQVTSRLFGNPSPTNQFAIQPMP